MCKISYQTVCLGQTVQSAVWWEAQSNEGDLSTECIKIHTLNFLFWGFYLATAPSVFYYFEESAKFLFPREAIWLHWFYCNLKTCPFGRTSWWTLCPLCRMHLQEILLHFQTIFWRFSSALKSLRGQMDFRRELCLMILWEAKSLFVYFLDLTYRI